jgi:hypothetical protein
MIREPLNSGIEARRGDVGTSAESCELFLIAEDAAAERLVLDGINALIFVGQCQEVCNLKHAPVIGYFTALVKGFFTDAL